MLVLYTKRREGEDQSRLVRDLLYWGYDRLSPLPRPMIAKDEYGKPYFEGRDDLFFSLSHTDTYVMCAIGGCPVGVDIQTRHEVRPALLNYACSPEELEGCDFFTLWCLKESFIKLQGKHDRKLKEMTFLPEDEQFRPPEPGIRCQVFGGIPGCAAALCWRGAEEPVLEEVSRQLLDPRET